MLSNGQCIADPNTINVAEESARIQKFFDESCQSKFGTQSYSRNGICTCVSGYVMSADNKCVATSPSKTNDQLCQDSYGTYSNWDGTKNNSGGLNCGCKSGYSWNSGQTACVYAQPKTNEEICQSVNGVNSTVLWLNETNGNPICGCKKGYEWAKDGKSCKSATVYPPASGGGGGGGGSAITPKANPVQKVEKQEPAKKVTTEEKNLEVTKTETKSTPATNPYGENWQTKFVHWVVNLFK
jgi:hypothetical protein